MAQVRKLQSGASTPEKKKKEEEVLAESKPVASETATSGSAQTQVQTQPQAQTSTQAQTTSTPQVPVTPKYGRFFRGTKTLEGELGLNRLNDLDVQGKGGLYTAAALAAYREGHDVYSGNDGSFQIRDTNGKDITDWYIKRKTSHVADSALRRNLGATFNSQRHQDRLNNELLMSINMDPEKVETPDNREELRRGSGWFTFNDGVYDTEGFINRDNEDKIRDIINYAMGDETAMNDKYKYSAWSDADRTRLRGFGNEFASVVDENGANIAADNLINAIRSGKELTDDQKQILKLMGFSKDASSGGGSGDGDGDNGGNPYQLEGVNGELMETMGITGIKSNKDENGNTYWTVEGDGFGDSTWDLAGFRGFDNTAFKNGWIHNGRLYARDSEITNMSLQNAVRKYLSNNAPTWDEWWTTANNAGVRFAGDTLSGGSSPFINFNPDEMYDKATASNPYAGVIWDFAKKNNLTNIGVRDVTNAYTTKNGWERLYAYVDPTDRDFRGKPNVRYFNEKGEPIKDPGAENPFGGSYMDPNAFSTVDTSGSAINGMFVHGTYTDKSNGQQMSILRDRPGNYYVYKEGANGKVMKPLAVDPTRIADLMDYIKNGWTWKDIEGLTNANRATNSSNSGSTGGTYPAAMGAQHRRAVDPQNYLKNGGTIDWNRLQKLQWGGYINNVAIKDPIIDNSKKSDITKDHAVDGSEGGLTSAEKWQIAGAIGDLVGVGASFGGIAGGWAGAGAGIAGTTAKFIGDVKKDGLQGKDIGNLALNTLFDVAALPASAFPGLDNWIKSSKFIRTMKSVGTPILKWLGTIGASNAVINTASKAINGEKLSSADLSQLVQGIAGGLVAGKQWAHQIQDAKLASTLAKRAASGVTVPTKTKIGNTEIENSALDQIVKEARGDANAIKSAIKKKLNLPDDTTIDLESIGLTKNRRGAWAWIRGKEKTFSYEQPKEVEPGSTFSYFMRGRARNAALGYRDANPEKGLNNLLDNVSAQQYQRIVSGGRGGLQNALRRAGLNNPNQFGFEMGDVVRPSLWRNNYYRNAIIPNKPTNTPVLLLPAAPTPVTPVAPRTIIPDIITPAPKPNNVIALPGGQRVLLLGQGVSYKFNRPIVTQANLPSKGVIQMPAPAEWYASRIQGIPARALQMPTARPINQIRYTPSVAPKPFRNHAGEVEVITKAGVRKMVRKKEGGLIPKYQLGGFAGKAYAIGTKYLPTALDLGEAIRSQAEMNQAYKQDAKALAGLKNYSLQAAQSSLMDFNASPYLQDYVNTKNTYLSNLGPNTYSDLGLSAANNQATAQALGKLSSQLGTNISSAVYQNDVNNNALMNQNEKNRIDAANSNLQYQTQINYQIDALKAQKTRDQNANIWAPISNQFRQNMRSNINRANQLSAQFDLQKLSDDLKQQQAVATQSLKNEWRTKFDNGEFKGSFDDYVVSNEIINQRYKDLLNTEKDTLGNYKTDFGKYYNETYLPKYEAALRAKASLSLKSGGTVEKTVQEEIATNADKMSKKAVEKMSDNLMKLLQQLLK